MKPIDLFLSEQRKYDKIVTNNVKLSMFQETFCFNSNGSKPNKQNIVNNKVSLFTFDDEMVGYMFDVSKLFIQNTQQTIANDFLSYMALCKYNTTNYVSYIKNHIDIKKYIDTKCNERIRNDMRMLKKEACVVRSNNNEKNTTCSNLLFALTEQCQSRFTDTCCNISSIPLIKNDTINYFYTITAGTLSRTYLIKLILV